MSIVIFKKFSEFYSIQRRLLEIRETNNIDLTGHQQHGFKKNNDVMTIVQKLEGKVQNGLLRKTKKPFMIQMGKDTLLGYWTR